MSDWFKDHCAAMDTLFTMSCRLKRLSSAFGITGNCDIEILLKKIADEIDSAQEKASQAVGQSISEGIDRAGETSTAILKAALAGAFLGSKHEKNKLAGNNNC